MGVQNRGGFPVLKHKYWFDLDDTLLDTREAVRAAYELVAPGVYSDAFWGQSAAAWNCPPHVAEAKRRVFPRFLGLVSDGYAMRIFQHASWSPLCSVAILTGASREALDAHVHAGKLPVGVTALHSVPCDETKAEMLNRDLWLADKRKVHHYYDDHEVLDIDPKVQTTFSRKRPTCATYVLAAGRGTRFARNGDTTPKPLTLFAGKRFVEYAVHAALEVSCDLCVVAASEPVALGLDSETLPPRTQTLVIAPQQPSQVESALRAIALNTRDKPHGPVLFLDSDVVFAPGVVHRFVSRATELSADAAVLTASRTWQQGTCSHVVCASTDNDRDSMIHTIAEGMRTFNQRCGAGAYFFGDAAAFVATATKLLQTKTALGELRMSDVVMAMRKRYAIATPSSNWIPLGSPEELEQAEEFFSVANRG